MTNIICEKSLLPVLVSHQTPDQCESQKSVFIGKTFQIIFSVLKLDQVPPFSHVFHLLNIISSKRASK